MDKQMQTYLRGQKNDMRALKQQAEIQNKIQMHALQVAVDTNAELKSINQTLNAMGFVMQDVAGSLQRQEKMHAEHYDAVKKEKALKEVLYNFKKFHATSSESGDAIVGASGARILSQMVAAAGFSTKDLSEIADKEYFDARMSDAKKLVSSLAGAQHQELDDFEYAYGAYQYLSGYDLAADHPFVSKTPKPPMPGELASFDPAHLPELFELAELEQQATPWKITTAMLATVVPFVASAILSNYGIPPVLSWVVCLWAALGVWYFKVAAVHKRIKDIKNRAIPPAHRGQTVKYLLGVLAPFKGYADQVGGERVEYDKEFAELSTGLAAKKAELAATINASIKAHPGLAEFYPPVG